MNPSSPCHQIEADLATLVDGEQTSPELERHLERCDRCAALLARAGRTGRALSALGEGFVLRPILLERVMVAAGQTGTPARAAPGAGSRRRWLASRLSASSATPLWRGAALAAALALGLGALAAGLAARRHTAKAGAGSSARSRSPAAVISAEGLAGNRVMLERRPKGERFWLPAGPGTPLTAGDQLRCGAHTRARVGLGTTSVLLNRGAMVEVENGHGLRLLRGDALADVARRRGEPPFSLHVPTGRVEVLGTRLHVSANQELAVVDVVRGRVRLAGPEGSLLVEAGQEGVLPARGAPRAGAAQNLGRTLAWTELSRAQGDGHAESLPVGLGSLTAHRPGRDGEKQALRLREHRVEARVQGFLARTEITETFENPTPHTLEGVYRFPLPGAARISRLALWVDGRLEEGTIVERDQATRIWRGVLRQSTPKALRKQEEYVWVPGPWRDPALLEWRQGNQFELRIFPIPPRSSRTVVLAYTETLPRTPRGRRYVYPLPHGRAGQSTAGLFSFELALSGHDRQAAVYAPFYDLQRHRVDGAPERFSYRASSFVPAGDVVVDFGVADPDAPLTVHTYRGPGDGEPGYALFTLRPALPAYRSDRPRSLCLVADRSYSTFGEAARRQRMLLAEILAEVDPRDEVALLACDTACRELGEWHRPSAAAAERSLLALDRVEPGGATDLGEALRAAGELLSRRADPGRPARVIYLGDGVSTVGEIEPSRLLVLARRHLASAGARLTTVGVGTAVDDKLLRALARAAGGSYVAYAPGSTARSQALEVMVGQYGTTLDEAEIELPGGLSRIAPRRPATLREGEELVVGARLEGRVTGDVVLRGRVNGEPFRASFPLDITASSHAGNAFVPRTWAQLFIDQLDLEPGEDSASVEEASPEVERSRVAEIVELSKRHHLLSRHTSLLVLESEAMRRAFGVARGRLTEDWTGEREAAEDNQAAQLDKNEPRSGRPAGARAVRLSRPDVASDPLTGLGESVGEGSGPRARSDDLDDPVDGALGSDEGGAGASARPPGTAGVQAPSRRQAGEVTVAGSLDREVIVRVIRQHMAAIRAAYERQLRRNPGLRGRVSVTFTIGPTGGVTGVRARGATEPELARALEALFARLRFPQPAGGGSITVTYPFVFQPSSGRSQALGSAPRPLLGEGRRWVRMRRVRVLEARLERLAAPSPRDRGRVEQRRRGLEARPDSRDRHRLLIEALSRAGEVEEVLRVSRAWLSREPTSVEALRLAADAAARLGDRAQALRTLSSILELDPRNARLHARLAELQADLGASRLACAHRLTLAALEPRRSSAAAAADSCRQGVLRSTPRSLAGQVTLRARWNGQGADLDLALVDARGRRLAWLGAAPGAIGDHLTDTSREELTLRRLPAGRYRVEVTCVGGAPLGAPIRGWLRVRALGEQRTIPFSLDVQRAYLAELSLEQRTELVPAP